MAFAGSLEGWVPDFGFQLGAIGHEPGSGSHFEEDAMHSAPETVSRPRISIQSQVVVPICVVKSQNMFFQLRFMLFSLVCGGCGPQGRF